MSMTQSALRSPHRVSPCESVGAAAGKRASDDQMSQGIVEAIEISRISGESVSHVHCTNGTEENQPESLLSRMQAVMALRGVPGQERAALAFQYECKALVDSGTLKVPDEHIKP